jgi:hypothetical protein
MDAQTMANALSGNFIGFKGGDTELLHELYAKGGPRSLADVPSNPRAFRFALKALAPELLGFGVNVEIFDTGMIHITRASDAQKEATLRRFFFSVPEAAEFRSEFGNSEEGFQRYAAYRRGVSNGQIHPPRRGANVIASEQPGSAQVDERLPLEEKCKQRWSLEPATRAEFGNSYERFLAYETAKARGVVRKFGPAA